MEFAEVPGWGSETWHGDVTGVAVDSRDRVYLLRRDQPQVTVLRGDGSLLGAWGAECLSDRPHLVSVSRDRVYVADDGGHRVHVFDTGGRLLQTIGGGTPSSTGFDDSRFDSAEASFGGMPGGPPFNRPTKAAASRAGDVFVSDGYRNCRVHRFTADGHHELSWGAAGSDPGSFVIPHSLTVDDEGRVLVCDRENDRIQFFTRDGELLDIWNRVQRPTDVAVDSRGYVYVTELPRGPADLPSWRRGPAERELPGRVTVLTPDGAVVGRLGPPVVDFPAPHAIAVSSTGAIYVAEVPSSFAAHTGRTHRTHRCLRKFEPRQT